MARIDKDIQRYVQSLIAERDDLKARAEKAETLVGELVAVFEDILALPLVTKHGRVIPEYAERQGRKALAKAKAEDFHV